MELTVSNDRQCCLTQRGAAVSGGGSFSPKMMAEVVTSRKKIPTIHLQLPTINMPINFFKKWLVKFFTIWQCHAASGQKSV